MYNVFCPRLSLFFRHSVEIFLLLSFLYEVILNHTDRKGINEIRLQENGLKVNIYFTISCNRHFNYISVMFVRYISVLYITLLLFYNSFGLFLSIKVNFSQIQDT
jgi:hypothetical protein